MHLMLLREGIPQVVVPSQQQSPGQTDVRVVVYRKYKLGLLRKLTGIFAKFTAQVVPEARVDEK